MRDFNLQDRDRPSREKNFFQIFQFFQEIFKFTATKRFRVKIKEKRNWTENNWYYFKCPTLDTNMKKKLYGERVIFERSMRNKLERSLDFVRGGLQMAAWKDRTRIEYPYEFIVVPRLH